MIPLIAIGPETPPTTKIQLPLAKEIPPTLLCPSRYLIYPLERTINSLLKSPPVDPPWMKRVPLWSNESWDTNPYFIWTFEETSILFKSISKIYFQGDWGCLHPPMIVRNLPSSSLKKLFLVRCPVCCHRSPWYSGHFIFLTFHSYVSFSSPRFNSYKRHYFDELSSVPPKAKRLLLSWSNTRRAEWILIFYSRGSFLILQFSVINKRSTNIYFN